MENNKITILSYYARLPGACQAEWLDDKIDSLEQIGLNVHLISSICSLKYHGKHYRVPSLSPTDFYDELKRSLELKESVNLLTLFLVIPLIFTFGILLDLLQYLATKGIGEGRWSWTFMTLPVLIFDTVFKGRPSRILTTGGPASAHLAGIVVGKLLKIPVIVELQDPLSGGGIGRNSYSSGYLYKVEKWIVANATKVVYVTKSAAEFAQKQFKAQNISYVYPGAKCFNVSRKDVCPDEYNAKNQANEKKIRLIHLGSLYSTRNFKTIIAALEKIISEGIMTQDDIELINLGHVADEIRVEILRKSYVKIFSPISRIDALGFAADCDVTLLIQNLDDRSKVTIPYKTYDYLNIGNKVLGLLNSEELTNLLNDHGHKAIDLKNINEIAEFLKGLFLEKPHPKFIKRSTIDPVVQVKKLIDIKGISL